MNFKEILIISFILLVLSLAAVSASDLDHVAISDSHCDSSIAHVPVTVSSHDDSVVIDNLHDVAVDDSSIDDGQSVPDDGSSIDDGDKSIPADDKKDSSADVDGDINDGDSIIINITNDTPKNNYNDKPISNVKEESGSFDDLQSLIDQSPKGTHLFLSRDYKGAKDQQVLINKDLVIEGQGHTIDCASVCRAIYSSSGNIVLRNLNIINGHYDTSCADDKTNNGGAICIGGKAKYTIENCNFTNNWADDNGGAIYNGADLALDIINCVFKGNAVDDLNGGAVYSVGDVLVKNSTFSSNHADDSGGAIYYAAEKSFNIINCLLKNNLADDCFGGAVYSKGDVHIDNSTLEGNRADDDGGAIYTNRSVMINELTPHCKSHFINNKVSNDDGGAIYAVDSVNAYDAEFYSNSALLDGGAIYSNVVVLENCTFDSNRAEGAVHKCYGGQYVQVWQM